ncbi:MAG: 1-(5-phosphoribosyl)-5-[(5-phosphoribosylamino)methylideneamino]imidazole-4-carboxamide isomerase [Candidatus Methanomethylicota archaeon]|uniref:1-(5-phosphoribosyl)-5-[(5-phosphoribosylamino)methylideneamino] imidazole-4-carboxamide isomerase n=1 Tax=Thermoproteota archaeon TaxID=2056631 RepID=A0A523BCD9_9CREN|nr:MAG: 1-(5-phosphoribosyl)-5-[(5-phosphoribosylamino)methylideneamino]imidazole-4-carboxamide isomerase [Candidatus Verstraetearchaeota archaeon]
MVQKVIKVIPAVDISGGKCVRLRRGRLEDATVYYDDPLEAARRWEGEGAELLHVIDLDAATGARDNRDAIKRIIREVKVPVQVGGGIRSIERAEEYINSGAERVIFGTAALELRTIKDALRSFGPERVMAAVDHFMGRVAVKGWKDLLELDAEVLCKRLVEAGVRKIMMTSIERDGMLKGPNLDYSLRVASSVPAEFYLAGGFSSIEDLLMLRGKRVAGVIIGRALYEGMIELKRAREVLADVE